MELSNNISQQESAPVQQKIAEAKPTPKQEVAEAKPTPKQEVKVQVQQVINQEPKKQEQDIDVSALIDTLNQALDPFKTSLRFGFDNSSDVFYVSVIDSNTNDTIRRFPVEQAESLVAKIHEIVGIILDERV